MSDEKTFGEIIRGIYKDNVDKIINEFIDKVKSDCIIRAKRSFKKTEFALLRDFQI